MDATVQTLPRKTIAAYAIGSLGTGGFATLPGLVLVDLNALVALLGSWELTSAGDINNAGQILGTACQNGSCASVLLTPVPEPAAGLLLLAGLGVLTQRRFQDRNPFGAGLAAAA